MLPASTTKFHQAHNEDNANNDGTQSDSESYCQAEYKTAAYESYNTVHAAIHYDIYNSYYSLLMHCLPKKLDHQTHGSNFVKS